MSDQILEPGKLIGAYRIIRFLGEGGMGAVYEVEHVTLGVRYALKTYSLAGHHAEFFRERFATEGKLLARLNHPNLVRVFDLGIDKDSGLLFFVMDLVLSPDGLAHSLADLKPGDADEDRLFIWFRQLASALDYVHSQGIVHRDIKLANLLLAADRHIVLSDFGISRILGERLRNEIGSPPTMAVTSASKLIVGTQGYVAPEVARGEAATPASDVYALGVVFFKLLTGVWYDGDLEPGAPRRNPQAPDAVKLLADFERPWQDVLPQMLASDPNRRPSDLEPLCAKLDEPQPRAPHWLHRHATLFAAMLSGLVIVSGALGWRWWNAARTPDVEDELIREAFAVPESLK